MPLTRPEKTRVALTAISEGDPSAAEDLLPLVYEELLELAHRRLAREPSGHTLQTTELVHEAYLRLIGDKNAHWDNRGHFFAAAARAMRRILVEWARRRGRIKHGGRHQKVELPDELAGAVPDDHTILVVDEVLGQLAVESAEAAELVKMYFFAGLTLDEAAEALGMSRATAYRKWKFARACLRLALQEAEGQDDSDAGT